MPALQPQAVPDKAMTFDLQALQDANTAPSPVATTTSAAPAQGPATTVHAVPVAQDTDFAAPQGPWMGVPSPSAPAPAQQQPSAASQPQVPSQPSQAPAPSQPAAAPQKQPQGNPWAALASQHAQTQPSGPPQQQGPQNPWPAMQSLQAGPPARPSVVAGPPVQQSAAPAPVQSASVKGPPVAAASAPAGPPPGATSAAGCPPATPAATPAQRQCFTNAEGLKICYMDDEQHKNTTDVHKEHGVNDYHNQLSGSEKEALQGHVPGNNVTASLNDLGQPQDPNNQQDGNTAFQGESDKSFNHQHDIHKDNATYSDHDTQTSNSDQDWKSSHKGKDGSKDMAEINREGQYENTSDTKIDEQGKDQVDVENWRGRDDHRFLSDKPGSENDSSLIWDEDEEKAKQREEWTGRDGVYDLHEESKGHSSVKASVDGDQGWTQFEQEMRDFDTAFNGDQAWKAKMKDLGMTTSALPAPAATGMVVKRDTPTIGKDPTIEDSDEAKYMRAIYKYFDDFYKAGEVDGLNKRDIQELVQASMDGVCKPDDTAFQCICRRSTDHISCAMAWPSEPTDQAEEKMLLQARGEAWKFPIGWLMFWKHKHDGDDDGKKARLASRGEQEQRSDIFDWLAYNEAQKDHGKYNDEQLKTLTQLANDAKHNKHHGHGHERRLAGLPEVDWTDVQDLNDLRLADMPHFDSSTLVVRDGGGGVVAAGVVGASTANDTNNSNMNKLSIIVLVCMIVLLVATVAVVVGRRVSTGLQKRKQRRSRQAYMQEIEGCHVVEYGRNGWQPEGSQQG